MTYQSTIAPDPVDAFRPWENDDKKAVRRRLLKARDISAMRARDAINPTARGLFWDANAIANRWCFAAAPVPDLTEIANGIVRLFLTANLVERMEGGNRD